jgi:hypothetical protein
MLPKAHTLGGPRSLFYLNVTIPKLLGPKKPTPEKLAPYECGMPPVGDARAPAHGGAVQAQHVLERSTLAHHERKRRQEPELEPRRREGWKIRRVREFS